MEGAIKKVKGGKKVTRRVDVKLNMSANLQWEEADVPKDKSKILGDEQFKVVVQAAPTKEQLVQLSPEVVRVQSSISQQNSILFIEENNNPAEVQKQGFQVIGPVEKEEAVVERAPLPQVELNQQPIETAEPSKENQQQISKQVKVEEPKQDQITLEEQFGIMKFSMQGKAGIKKQEGTKVKPVKKKKDSKKQSKISNIQQNFDLFEGAQQNSTATSKVEAEALGNIGPEKVVPAEKATEKDQDLVEIVHEYCSSIASPIQPQRSQHYGGQAVAADIQENQSSSKLYSLAQGQRRQEDDRAENQLQFRKNVIPAYIQEGDAFGKAQQFVVSKIGDTPAFSRDLNKELSANATSDIIEERPTTEDSESAIKQDIVPNNILIEPIQTKSSQTNEPQKQLLVDVSQQLITVIQLTKVNVKKSKKASKSGQPKKLPKSIIADNVSNDFMLEMGEEQQIPQLKSKQIIEERTENQADEISIGNTLMTNKEELPAIQDIGFQQILDNKQQAKEQQKPVVPIKSQQQCIVDKKEQTVLIEGQKVKEDVKSELVAAKEEMDHEQNYFAEAQIIEMSVVPKKKAGKKEAKTKRTATIKLEISEQPQPAQQVEAFNKTQLAQVVKQAAQQIIQKRQKLQTLQLHQQTVEIQEKTVQIIESEIVKIQAQKEIVLSIPPQPSEVYQEPNLQEEKTQTIQQFHNTEPEAEYSQIQIPMQLKETKKTVKKAEKGKTKAKSVKIAQKIQFVVEEQERQKPLEVNIEIPVEHSADKGQEKKQLSEVDTLKNAQQLPKEEVQQAVQIFKIDKQNFPLRNQSVPDLRQQQTIQTPINVAPAETVVLQQPQLKIQRQPQMQINRLIPAPPSQINQIQVKDLKPEQNMPKGQLTWQQPQSLLIEPQIIKANTKPSKKGTKKQAEKKKKQAIVQIIKQQNDSAQIQQIYIPVKLEEKEPSPISQTKAAIPEITNRDYEKSDPQQQLRPLSKQPSAQENTINTEANLKPSMRSPIVQELINLIRFHNDEQIRNMRERIKMLEEDIRSRMMRKQQLKRQDHIQALADYRGESQLFKDIVEENLLLKKEYSACKNR